VIDRGLLRTTVMEAGNGGSKDLDNGRIVPIPNNIVLKVPVFNYSQGFRFVRDEIKVLFTPETYRKPAALPLARGDKSCAAIAGL
jgi:small-conductance mechanosensitive channel